MASQESALPSWASSVVFPFDNKDEVIKVLQLQLREVEHQWWQVGLQLKQRPAPLDGFKANPGKATVQQKFEQMLRHWLDNSEPRYRTWGALAKAVEETGNKALAKRVRRETHYEEGSKADIELVDLSKLLQQMTPQWKTLSINLGIPMWVSEGFDEKLSAAECFRNVLDKWISTVDEVEEPTLEVLYKALESHSVANRALGIKILKDVKVLELLTDSEKAKDGSVKDQLKRYIAGLKTETDGIAAEVDDLPAPPTTKPGTVSSTSETEKVLVENK